MSQHKVMDSTAKLTSILSFTEIVDNFALNLAREELGKEKLKELQGIWEKVTLVIPSDLPENEKYEIAYRNFMWKWVSANNFMRKNLGDAGTADYMKAAISGWNRKYAQGAFFLKILGGISRRAEFKILAKQLAYQLQVFSPFTIAKFDEKQMVLNVAPCKILQDQNGAGFCSMACQNIVPSWLQSQFNVKMISNRKGENCVVTFEPFST